MMLRKLLDQAVVKGVQEELAVIVSREQNGYVISYHGTAISGVHSASGINHTNGSTVTVHVLDGVVLRIVP